MEIVLAKSAGFCFGVDRAVNMVYEGIEKGKALVTYGPIIHNKEVVKQLEQKGVRCINELSLVEKETVVIRSHGVEKVVYQELEQRGISYLDGTCPYVKKIHKIAEKASENGRLVVLFGNPEHPEVKGIIGWCHGCCKTVQNMDECKETFSDITKAYTVVAQTTFQYQLYQELATWIQEQQFDVEIFNTICAATSERQEEAQKLSSQMDIMLVIGDASSSNTRKLFEICKNNCKKSYYIETIQDLVLNNFDSNVKIGITAGASTPPAIIKEVISVMNEGNNETLNGDNSEELSFQEMLDQSFVSLHSGDIVRGTVISVNNEEVSVNLGYKSDGIIARDEYSSDPNELPSLHVQSGDEIEVFVVRVNDGEGNVLLSRKRLEAQKGLEEIEKAFEDKTPISGKVTEVVKGGIIAVSNGVRVFIPSSQVSNRFVEDLNGFRGQQLSFQIIELDRMKRRIIGGRKAMLQEEVNAKKEKLFQSVSVGDKLTGTVSRLTDFGAFVDLGGVDGLVHISELSWGRVTNPREILSEGQVVTVVIIGLDKEKGKISLSLKDKDCDPWNEVEKEFQLGTVLEGKVVRMVPFGAFVELKPGVDGLVHISQISSRHVAKPEEELSIGQTVQVKIMDVNEEQRKISLSIKELDAPAEEMKNGNEEEGQDSES